MRDGRAPNPSPNRLLFAEAVAERHAVAGGMVGIEFHIISHQVKSRFRTQEDAAFHVKAQTSAEVSHKVIAAGVVRTSCNVAAAIEIVIEADALNSDTREQFRSNPRRELRGIDGVEVPKQRPIRLESVVNILVSAPVDFSLHTKILPEKIIAVESQVGAAPDRGRRKQQKASRAIGRRRETTHGETKIELLSFSGTRHTGERHEYCKHNQLSQSFLRSETMNSSEVHLFRCIKRCVGEARRLQRREYSWCALQMFTALSALLEFDLRTDRLTVTHYLYLDDIPHFASP